MHRSASHDQRHTRKKITQGHFNSQVTTAEVGFDWQFTNQLRPSGLRKGEGGEMPEW